MCLQQGKRQRDGEIIGWLRSTDNFSPILPVALTHTHTQTDCQQENGRIQDTDTKSEPQSQAVNATPLSFENNPNEWIRNKINNESLSDIYFEIKNNIRNEPEQIYSIYVELFNAKVQRASGQLYVLVEIDGYLKLKTEQSLTIVYIF